MRDYLKSFFEEFDFDKSDSEFLIAAYDKIASNENALNKWNAILEAYDNDILLDYTETVINGAKAIGDSLSIHPYTSSFLIFACMSRRLRILYEENGIDLQIYRESMPDMKWKLEECKAVKGIVGSSVVTWFPGFFRLKRFGFGRLQFEVVNIRYDYSKNGVVLKKDESKVINVHIPRSGTPIDKESCDLAYAKAREFFKDEVGENCPFVCYSWLLFPENKNILSPESNTYRFMSEYDIIEWGYNLGEDLWRLFDTEDKNPYRLPTNGSFRRRYVEHLKNGGRVGWGYGVKL